MGTQSGNVKELWGRNFKIVRNGLDEAEVFSFVGNLIDQNNEYALKLENLDTLIRLAENTVIEANKQAESSKVEIEEKANVSAAALISEAEQKAKTETGIIITEAQEKANAEAERVLVESQEQVKEINEKAERALAEAAKQAEAQEKANAEAERVLAEAADTSREKISTAEQQAQDVLKVAGEEAEQIKASAEEEAPRIVAEARQKAEESATMITAAAEEAGQNMLSASEEQVKEINEKAEREALTAKQEAEQLLIRSKKIAEREIKEKFQRVHQKMISTLGLEYIDETTATPMEETTTPEPFEPVATAIAEAESQTDELQEQQPAIEQEEVEAESELEATAYAQEEESTAESEGIQPAIEQEDVEAEQESLPLYEGTVELKIPPPIPFDRMLQLHKNLKQIPEIGVTNVQRLGDKGLTMELRLQSPIPLLKIIGNLPEVEKVSDDALSGAEGTALARRTKAKPRSGNTIIVTIKG